MHQRVREITVVSEQKKPLGVLVEAANRENTVALVFLVQQLHDGRSAEGIGYGGKIALGFVEHDMVTDRRFFQRLAVKRNDICMRIYLCCKRFDDRAVTLYSAFVDELFDLAS